MEPGGTTLHSHGKFLILNDNEFIKSLLCKSYLVFEGQKNVIYSFHLWNIIIIIIIIIVIIITIIIIIITIIIIIIINFRPPRWSSGQHVWLLNGVYPASWGQLRSYLIEK